MQGNHFVTEQLNRAISCTALSHLITKQSPWAETRIHQCVSTCLYHHLEGEQSSPPMSLCFPCHTAEVSPLWLGSGDGPHWFLDWYWALQLEKKLYPRDCLGHALTHYWLKGTATHLYHSRDPTCSSQQPQCHAVEFPHHSARHTQ